MFMKSELNSKNDLVDETVICLIRPVLNCHDILHLFNMYLSFYVVQTFQISVMYCKGAKNELR